MASLSVIFGVNDAELQAAIKRAKRGLGELGGELRTAATDIAKWGTAAVAAGAALSAHMVKGAIEAADAQAKLAQSVHTSFNSLSTLEIAGARAGVSMEEITRGAQKLDVTLAKAATMADQGAAAALDRLGLKARELQMLPLDQRIATINDALAKNIPVTEQAAVAAEVFGDKMQATMRKLSGDEIKQAAADAEFFGLKLSDIDAKKLEMANDSFDEMGLAVKGVWRTIAVELAPIIVTVWKEIKKAADEAGGFGKIAVNAFESVMTAAGFVADAVDGIKRTFIVVANGIVMIIADMVTEVTFHIHNMLALLDKVPGIDFTEAVDSVRQFNVESQSVVKQAREKIDETLMAPMPSETFKKWVEEARKATNEAAAVMVESDKRMAESSVTAEEGMNENYRKSLETRLQTLREHLMTKEALSFEQQAKEMAQIAEFEAAKLVSQQEAQLLREEVEMQHWERISEIRRAEGEAQAALEQKKNAEIQKGVSTFLGNLSGLMNTHSKKAFEVGKAAALTEAGIKAAQGVMSAWSAGMSTGGPWAPLIAAAYAGAAAINGANMINNIRKQQFGGGGGNPTAPTQGASNIDVGNAGGGGQAQSQTTIVQFHGGSDSDRDLVRRFTQTLNDNNADGGRIIVT